MSNELVKQENVEMIVKNAPQSYNENQISHDRCIETGKKLLADIYCVVDYLSSLSGYDVFRCNTYSLHQHGK